MKTKLTRERSKKNMKHRKRTTREKPTTRKANFFGSPSSVLGHSKCPIALPVGSDQMCYYCREYELIRIYMYIVPVRLVVYYSLYYVMCMCVCVCLYVFECEWRSVCVCERVSTCMWAYMCVVCIYMVNILVMPCAFFAVYLNCYCCLWLCVTRARERVRKEERAQ